MTNRAFKKEQETQRRNPVRSSFSFKKTDMTRHRSRLPAAAATTVLFAVVALLFYPRETSAHKKFTFTTTHANELE